MDLIILELILVYNIALSFINQILNSQIDLAQGYKVADNCNLIIILVMQQDQAAREEQLYGELFLSGSICEFCRLSEEILKCDILMSQTKCAKHMCVDCFQKRRDDPCQCGSKYVDHYIREGRIRPALKHGHRDEFEKYFHREHKIRKNEQFQNLDYDLVNLMTYLSMNPASYSSKRVSYIALEEQVKKAIREKKREERTVMNERSAKKKAFFINREKHQHDSTGLQSCGYQRTYNKGFDLMWRAFVPNEPYVRDDGAVENKSLKLADKSMVPESSSIVFEKETTFNRDPKLNQRDLNA